MDADLIMLGLCTHRPNFHILRENHRDKREVYHIDLSSVRNELVKLLCSSSRTDPKRLIDDFVLILFTVGNDFLPHLPAVEIITGGVEVLIEVYKKTDRYLTYRDSENKVWFDQTGFSSFFRILALYEEQLINTKINTRASYESDTLLEKHTKIDKGAYKISFDNYRNGYYDKHFAGNRDCVKEYLEGVQWVLSYYTSGVPDWTWCYPHYYAPFSEDLADVLSSGYTHRRYPRTEPLKPFEQLMCVLPSTSSKLLPYPLCNLLTSPNSPIAEFYPTEFKIDTEGKRNAWESIAILPRVDLAKIKKAFSSVSEQIDRKEMKRCVRGNTYLYRVDNTSVAAGYTHKCFYGTLENCPVETYPFEL
jgi:5'-3' exoribonuclease 1